ncbi:hypothetical protein [Corynebacterium sp. ACRPQ]|uniref:hypothetical protein n=1 Tax=Corynebacterium sp. ACRPQ TaxID=2918201 RepID=UPI001EF20EB9|nr:hypothetical protein [Corynebacterium sp. ACRPQ]MCG7442111.1 hypothetical protein [Corynebacterium sp. ACRPQ]
MNKMRTLLDGIADAFKGSTTGTGLDTVSGAPVPALVAESLLDADKTPATTKDIAEVFEAVTGHAPDEHEMLDAELFLLDFDWLQ